MLLKRENYKNVRITESQYKSLVGGMFKKERKDYARKQKEFWYDREDNHTEAWGAFEYDGDDMGRHFIDKKHYIFAVDFAVQYMILVRVTRYLNLRYLL